MMTTLSGYAKQVRANSAPPTNKHTNKNLTVKRFCWIFRQNRGRGHPNIP